MRTLKLFATIVAILFATATIGAAAGQKVTAKPPKVSAPKVSAPKAAPARGPKGVAKAPKGASAKSSAKAAGAKGRSAGTTSETTTNTGADTTVSGDTSTGGDADTGADPTVPPAEPNAISMKIASNPAQKARVQAMLPEGMTLEAATAGFRNQGQFLAALNVSQNQGLDFVALQTAMTKDGLSLGQAVQKVKSTPPAPTTPPQDEQ